MHWIHLCAVVLIWSLTEEARAGLIPTTPTIHPQYLITYTCVGIHPGRVEPVSPIALTTSRVNALQARRSCASSLDTFTLSFLHRAWPKTRGPESGSRSALIVVAHVFSWPPARLRHMRGGVGRRISLISSPSGRLAACPNQRSLLCTSSVGMLVRQRRRRSSTDGTQSLHLTRRMRRMLSLSKASNILSPATRTGHVSQP